MHEALPGARRGGALEAGGDEDEEAYAIDVVQAVDVRLDGVPLAVRMILPPS